MIMVKLTEEEIELALYRLDCFHHYLENELENMEFTDDYDENFDQIDSTLREIEQLFIKLKGNFSKW